MILRRGLRGLGQCTYEGDPTCDAPVVNVTSPSDTATTIDIPFYPGNSGGAVPPISPTPPLVGNSSPSSGSFTSDVNAVATATAAAIKAYNATQSPYLIPGTNLVANPAGTPIGSALGVTGSQLAGVTSSLAPVMILAIGAFLLISMAGKR